MTSLQDIARALGGEVRGAQVLAPAPGHPAIDRGMSVKPDGKAPGGFLVHLFNGGDPIAAKDFVRARLGLPTWQPAKPRERASVAARYIYRDQNGAPYLRVTRTNAKDFYQHHWIDGAWVKGKPPGPAIPYRLPELLAAEHQTVLIAEGEKDAANLAKLGFVATTNAGGAGKWPADLTPYFAGRDVYIIPDNDQAGEDHAAQIAASLKGVARNVRIVRLPGLPPKGDASDWIATGGTAEALARIMETPEAKPAPRFQFGPFGSIKVTSNVEYLVRDVLPARGLVVIYGEPKCGKSFWTFDAAMHVALGIDYRGKTTRAGAVAYLAAEGGGGFPKRIEAYRQCHPCPPDTPFYLCPSRADLITNVAELIAGIKAAIGGNGPALVVIDTLNRTFAGNENDARDMGAYLRAAATIEDAFGCCVALIHHSGLAAGRPRGSTSLPAAADAQISVERDSAGNVVATVQLSKDSESGHRFASKLDVVEIGHDENGEPITSCIVVPVDAGPAPRAKPGLSQQAELARRYLAEAIASLGQVVAIVPAGASKAVRVDEWRQECYRRGLGGNEPETQRKAFGRAKERLAMANAIGELEGWAWLPKPVI